MRPTEEEFSRARTDFRQETNELRRAFLVHSTRFV